MTTAAYRLFPPIAEDVYMMFGARYHRVVLRVVFGLGLVSGCGVSPDTAVEQTPEQRFGEFELPLISPDSAAHRLRKAVFKIADRRGNQVLQLDSEQDPEARELRATLAPDSYSSTLEDGWTLERLLDNGTAVPVQAALLTRNPSDFEIRNGDVTRLVYAFTTDEGVVQLGQGALGISIAVAPSEAQPSCDLLNPQSCDLGQTCLLANAEGRTFCAEAGSLPVGSPCDAEQCVAGAQCLSLSGEAPDLRICRRFCNVAQPPRNCACHSLDFSAEIGICVGTTPPPPFPEQCTEGVDPSPQASPWVVCEADAETAWVSANFQGFFHVESICKSLGYVGVSQIGGTCGNVCGYCEGTTSCESRGQRFFDGSGECGLDELGRVICETVMWECTNDDSVRPLIGRASLPAPRVDSAGR